MLRPYLGFNRLGATMPGKYLRIVVDQAASLSTTDSRQSDENARLFKEKLDNSKHLVS